MAIHKSKWIKIVENASGLWERNSPPFVPRQTDCGIDTKALLEKWCTAATAGDTSLFAFRLALENLDIPSAKQRLLPVKMPLDAALPLWAEIAAEAVEGGSASAVGLRPDTEAPLAFEEVFAPFVFAAARRLRHRAAKSLCLLSDEARASMERSLLEQLSAIYSKTMEAEFSLFRKEKNISKTADAEDGPDQAYKAFVLEMQTGKLFALFETYPVLARLLGETAERWILCCSEFLSRLQEDLPHIAESFFGGPPPAQVAHLEMNLSDSHHGGRRVAALTFSDGSRLIYKPRDLSVEMTFGAFLTWLNTQSLSLDLKAPQILNKEGYGWMEYIPHSPCPDEGAVTSYYQRVGLLAALLYCLNGSDCHFENIIAQGEYPILIDMETLFQPDKHGCRKESLSLGPRPLGEPLLDASVFRTGLFPGQYYVTANMAFDISGIGAGGGWTKSIPRWGWLHTNTDKMRQGLVVQEFVCPKNLPLTPKAPCNPQVCTEYILKGFEEMYGFFMKHQALLTGDDSPLRDFIRCQVRFVFRPTALYSLLLKKVLDPAYLGCGIPYSIELDSASRFLWTLKTPETFYPLLREELKALSRRDIPYFSLVCGDGTLIAGENHKIEAFLPQSPYGLMIEKIQHLNTKDLAQQKEWIFGAMYAKGLLNKQAAPPFSKAYDNLKEAPCLSYKEALQEALSIADMYKKRALKGPKDSIFWVGLGYEFSGGFYRVQPTGFDLFGGASGIALFFAALKKVTGEKEYGDMALAALKPLCRALDKVRAPHRANIGIGTGIGGYVYGLTQAAVLLKDSRLLDYAAASARLLTPPLIEEDKKLNLTEGIAGSILALLSLYGAVGGSEFLDKALHCGDHLLRSVTFDDSGTPIWKSQSTKIPLGFSTGLGGISYVLAALYSITQNTCFQEGALKFFIYEHKKQLSNLSNTGIPFSGYDGFWPTCLGMLPVISDAALTDKIKTSLAALQNSTIPPTDQLYCGGFGLTSFLSESAKVCQKSDLHNCAKQIASFIVKTKGKKGYYTLFPDYDERLWTPGFFQGTAGVGYELLRLFGSDSLPNILFYKNA